MSTVERFPSGTRDDIRHDPRGQRALVVAAVGFWLAFFAPTQVLLALTAAEIAPDSKARLFGTVTAVGSLVLLCAYPAWGVVSDRFRYRWGRRPFAIIGTGVSVGALIWCSMVRDPAALVLAWACAHVGLGALQCSIEATFADRTHPSRRSRMAGVLSAAQMGGALIGSVIATAAPDASTGYLLVAAATVLTVGPFFGNAGSVSAEHAEYTGSGPDPDEAGEDASGVRVDLVLAWVGRLCVMFGLGCVTQFLLYFVTDHLGADRPDRAVLVLTLGFVVTSALCSVMSGRVAARLGDGRAVSLAGALCAGVALFAFDATTSLSWTFVAAIGFGTGLGICLGAGFGVITARLRSPRRHGRDLGIFNMAVVLPQLVAPLAAVRLLESTGSYGSLFRFAGLTIVVGGVAMFCVGRTDRRHGEEAMR
ncbi:MULTISPECIES: MFS transporter [Rhodococcus]|uniref:MFS transporter n=1 Tax=Rhodococcus TaxID=1827 RepID=UPI001E5F470C|nr:MFS transporter [Rhodococcus pyridinivorans]MCD2116032.1 MFS transporter [Rhodococcus pyridinivorans]MCZ4624896.1 MFS transporter [Rhodococcus pyridinivorans]MCZ4646106.1 MFS transporter [Rhodococcus pyridinivorans]MDJ0482828.1 MFS transporter [Rhodococcus pyridinivorans]MDV7251939.1 MFS transporter [Rhodococcus pyridinivorans]